MNKIKSLADRLREEMAAPSNVVVPVVAPAAYRKKKDKPAPIATVVQIPEILSLINAYDSTENKSMVHVKLDAQTAKLVGHFKLATGIDNIKLGAFAVKHLFDTHPELKTYIKNFIQNLDL